MASDPQGKSAAVPGVAPEQTRELSPRGGGESEFHALGPAELKERSPAGVLSVNCGLAKIGVL